MRIAEPTAVGSVWREKRREYNRRTVVVETTDAADIHGFVHLRTLTTTSGHPPAKTTRSRVRLKNFHRVFQLEPTTTEETP